MAEDEFPTAQQLKIHRLVERFSGVCHQHKIADCRTCSEKELTMEKCEHCGLTQGHANKCFADILIQKLVALEYVVERAKILIEAPTDHAKLVALGKLKDAVAQVDRIEDEATSNDSETQEPPRCCSFCKHPSHFPSEPYGLYWVCNACGKETQRVIEKSTK